GRSLAEALVAGRFGGAATLDSFEVQGQEAATEPFTLKAVYRVPAYARLSGKEVKLAVPYLSGLRENPLPAGEREVPVQLGYPGEYQEQVRLTIPAGCAPPAVPSRTSTRTADLRYKVSHSVEESVLSSTREVRIREATVEHEGVDDLRGAFDEMVATDASELVLQRQSVKTTSTR
ncbi:MAG TPA: hypothetical protein VKU85_19595, partial [bacterium]|nr:hypothetical protein [bacterium]